MVISAGSSNHVPPLPAKTPPETDSFPPEVSIWPPIPVAVPKASILPATLVVVSKLCASLHNTTLPPSPTVVALALISAPACMSTVEACCKLPLPCQSPPTSTVPPPACPEALMRESLGKVILSPTTVTLPPLAPASRPWVLIWPPATTSPAGPASKTIWPFTMRAELACSSPPVLTT